MKKKRNGGRNGINKNSIKRNYYYLCFLRIRVPMPPGSKDNYL